MQHFGSAGRTLVVLTFLGTCGAAPTARTGEAGEAPVAVRTRANAWVRMAVPEPGESPPVIVDVIDPWGHIVWTGATRTDSIEFLARDWADGVYTVRFTPGGEKKLKVDSEYYGRVWARAGLMVRQLEKKRDPDGILPKELAGASNLLQRIITEYVWQQPDDHVEGHLTFCQQRLGITTATATVRILGSGAADWDGYEGSYRPGRRERSSVFMPPNTMVDFGTDAMRRLRRWGYSAENVEHLFISHEHADHFDPASIAELAANRRDAGLSPLVVHGSKIVCDRLRDHLSKSGRSDMAVLDEMQAGGQTRAGELQVKAVRAAHATSDDPLCFILKRRGATVYYGTDSGYPKAEAFAALAAERFDVFAIDTTFASSDDGREHGDVGDLVRLVDRLRAAGAIDTWTTVLAIHQSRREGPTTIPDMPVFTQRAGFACSYDGMPIPIAFCVTSQPAK
ncbi:MAG TPA: MBL fold metallo-hydrolase [Phycisphaerae bacterium]|nr:MBL fold metallo-hydrolase [Phycisphaerae bacterium]HRR86266.1 MBL fold metallo-hydrolase [Phycisphaerae bacterium]